MNRYDKSTWEYLELSLEREYEYFHRDITHEYRDQTIRKRFVNFLLLAPSCMFIGILILFAIENHKLDPILLVLFIGTQFFFTALAFFVNHMLSKVSNINSIDCTVERMVRKHNDLFNICQKLKDSSPAR